MEDSNIIKKKVKIVPKDNSKDSLKKETSEIMLKIKKKLISIINKIIEKTSLLRLAFAFRKWKENCNFGGTGTEKKKKKLIKKKNKEKNFKRRTRKK